MRTLSLILLVALLFVSGGCSTQKPPPMARSGELQFGGPSPDWTTRLQSRFPVGTPEAPVIAALKQEGFHPATRLGERTMTYDWFPGLFPICSYTLTAEWNVDAAGRLARITGAYWSACP